MRTGAAVATMLVAASCTGGGADTTVTMQIFGDPAEARAYQQLIDVFEDANPGVGVRLTVVGSQDDHMTKLTTAFSAGNPPDLFLINYRRFAQLADRGVLEPLETRLDRSGVLREADLYPEAVDAFRFGGPLVCLPQNISTPVVYYNEDLLNDAGLPPPPDDWTWDDLVTYAKAMTGEPGPNGIPEVRGLGFEPSLNRFAPFVWQAGGRIVDDQEEPTTMTLLEPEAIEALEYLTALQHVHRVVPSLVEFESEEVESRFAAGRLGMLIDSRRVTTSLRAVPDLDWDVAPLPVHPVRREQAVVLHSDAYCMAKASTVKDAAFRFVEFALGPEGAPIIARTGRTVPSLRSVAESPVFLDPTQPPARARAFLDQIPAIHRFPSLAIWNEVESKTDPIIEEWFLGQEPTQFLGLEVDLATLQVLRAGT